MIRDEAVHRRVLGTAIGFSQEHNAIACRGRDLDMPIPAADATLNREVRRWLDTQLANLRDEPAQQARQIVRMLLPSGLCSVDRVAQHLGMHRRTLNRHLAAEGESVTTIIDAVRLKKPRQNRPSVPPARMDAMITTRSISGAEPAFGSSSQATKIVAAPPTTTIVRPHATIARSEARGTKCR